MYIKILENGTQQSYSIEQLKLDNPNVSFPETIKMSTLEEYGVYPCKISEKPIADERTHIVKLKSYAIKINGIYVYEYDITEKSIDEISAYDAFISQEVRTKRNILLLESDWVVTKSTELGTPIPAEWIDYRRELRDIPAQFDFPYNIIWPIVPNS